VFGKGSPKAKTAGAKGGRKSTSPGKGAAAPASAGASKGKSPDTRMKPGGTGKRGKSKG
jgi:hypothetical protein